MNIAGLAPGAFCPLNREVKTNYCLMNVLERSALFRQQHSFHFYGCQAGKLRRILPILAPYPAVN